VSRAAVVTGAGPADRAGAAARWGRLALARGGLELRLFFRERAEVLGTFGLPVVLLAVLGSIFDTELATDGVGGGAIYTTGIIVLAVGAVSLVNLGIGVATDRDDGSLARLRRVPAPATVYLAGKVILVLVTCLAAAALVLAAGVVMFDLALPTDPARWLTFGWVFALGVTACALLGVAISGLAGSARAAGAMMNLPFLVLNFASGVLVPAAVLPPALRAVGEVFPLAWMAQGFRSALLPDAAAAYEPAGAWEHGRIALMLVAWCIGGLVLCLTTFRWRSRRDG
jgi:ABC-2 type transport system permease protein